VARVNTAADLPDDLGGTVGVTAGASAPESLVNEVIDHLAPTNGVEVVRVTTEGEYFPPPPELRELLRGIATSLLLLNGSGAEPPSEPSAGDRDVFAADVLELLAL
jgi:4-hydroxy-3-methylbut-2-enyl diphosphate reductase